MNDRLSWIIVHAETGLSDGPFQRYHDAQEAATKWFNILAGSYSIQRVEQIRGLPPAARLEHSTPHLEWLARNGAGTIRRDRGNPQAQ